MLPLNEIICGDCLEVMKDWPDNCVDLVVTSPPYGELRSYMGARVDSQILTIELFRIIKLGRICVWVTSDQVIKGSESGESFRQALHFMSTGFNLHDTMIYSKLGVNYPESNRYYNTFEYMFVFSKGRPIVVHLLKDRRNTHIGSRGGTCRQADDSKRQRSETFINPVGEYGIRWNVWEYKAGFNLSSKEPIAFEHPAIFPEQLAEDHILSWSNPDDIVLDPMNGSGTTTKMASKLGRRYIGIDISEKYCQVARQRLEAVDTGVTVAEQNRGQMALFGDTT